MPSVFFSSLLFLYIKIFYILRKNLFSGSLICPYWIEGKGVFFMSENLVSMQTCSKCSRWSSSCFLLAVFGPSEQPIVYYLHPLPIELIGQRGQSMHLLSTSYHGTVVNIISLGTVPQTSPLVPRFYIIYPQVRTIIVVDIGDWSPNRSWVRLQDFPAVNRPICTTGSK